MSLDDLCGLVRVKLRVASPENWVLQGDVDTRSFGACAWRAVVNRTMHW